jgi:hypothetical protein
MREQLVPAMGVVSICVAFVIIFSIRASLNMLLYQSRPYPYAGCAVSDESGAARQFRSVHIW